MPTAELNGTHLFYQEVGSGHPCLVMHGGLGFDHTGARPWIDQLGDTLRLIYYDHRGNGRSGRPSLETLSYAQFAADAGALRDHLGFDQIAALGFSAGGAIALHYALADPEHLTHLMLVGAHAAWDYQDEITANLARRQATPEMLAAFSASPPATDTAYAAMFKLILPLYFHRFDPALSSRFTENVVWSASAYVRYSEIMRDHNVAPRLGEIEVPTLVMVGRDDFITPLSQAERLQQGMPNADLVVFERSGHMPYIEEPERFATTVRDWLAKH